MLKITNLSVTRGTAPQQFTVTLPQLELNEGEIIAISGVSGCGKSTLLEMIGLVLSPTNLASYQLDFNGKNIAIDQLISYKKHSQLAQIRAENIGFMLQSGGLLPFLTVRENIKLPYDILAANKYNISDFEQKWVAALCQKLNVEHLLDKLPKHLSIGERQRIAFIRAIVHKPLILLADEPTSALDPIHARKLFEVMQEIASEYKISILIVTHDWELIKKHKLRNFYADYTSNKQQSIFLEKSLDG